MLVEHMYPSRDAAIVRLTWPDRKMAALTLR